MSREDLGLLSRDEQVMILKLTTADILAYLDGQRACVAFGHDRSVEFKDGAWRAQAWNRGDGEFTLNTSHSTLREALEALIAHDTGWRR